MRRCIALIPAAGSGSRMGSPRPKQYLEIEGKPLLQYSVRALAEHARIDRVVLVISEADDWLDQYDWSPWQDKLQIARVGGATRGESVLNGLNWLSASVGPDDWILVHDAARPGLNRALIDRLLNDLSDDDVGGLLALPVADTVKAAEEGDRVRQTRSRDGLWQAQTPQMFKFHRLKQALQQADPAQVTDEASAIELLGLKPKLVRGALFNWKVTYPDDLDWVSLWLKTKTAG